MTTFNTTGALNVTKAQWFSIITSAMSFSIGNLEYFLDQRNKSGLKNIIIYYPIFFLTSIFKVMALSIILTFNQIWSFLSIFLGILICGYFFLGPIRKKFHFRDFEAGGQRGLFNFGWLTITALNKNPSAARDRPVYTYFFFLFYTLYLISITLICNINPSLVTIPSISGEIIWADFEIVQNITHLNAIVGTTIGVGAMAFVVDYFLYEKLGRVIHEDLESFDQPVRDYWTAFKLSSKKY